jgi:sulfonate dioxygenase
VSPNFGSYIVDYKKEESDYLLNFLNLHVSLGIDFQARVNWEPGTVVVFDNRTVLQY